MFTSCVLIIITVIRITHLGMLAIGGGGGGSIKIPFLRKMMLGTLSFCICLDRMRKLMMQLWIMMLMMVMLLKMTWGAEGDEGRHSSGGSVAASPSLKI